MVKLYPKEDIKHVSVLYQALSEIYAKGKTELEYSEKDLHYLYSLRSRLINPEYREPFTIIINELEEGFTKVSIDLNTKSVKFLRYVIGIITGR